KGTALYIAAPVFGSYWHSNHFWVRRIVDNLLRSRYGKYAEVEAPTHIETNLMRKDGKTYLHVINFQSNHAGEKSTAFYNPIENITPVHDIRVVIRDNGLRKAVMRPDNVDLPVEATEDGIAFTIPRVHIHAIIELSKA
ncbi:MAG: hypothetical protein K0R28_4217, partial [Paenibacillus sp.]|nr:hypothetical protein [Paenibacillus sp.]